MASQLALLKDVNIFAGQCLIHTPHRTEFPAHTAGIAVILFRAAAVPDRFGRLRIQRALELCIPIEIPARVGHTVINLPCARDPLGNIRSMSSNFGRNDSLFHILYVGQGQRCV